MTNSLFRLVFSFLAASSLSFSALAQHDWTTPFEHNDNTSATYAETVDFYETLAAAYPQLQLTTFGRTDSGFPLHVAVLSKDRDFSPASLKAKGKRILFINNAIHAGEPCGVDATMMLLRDYLQKEELQAYLDHVVLVVIPFYNIGGGLNRSSYSRANQQGPLAYGFRGNARNLDLNRDFIKCDSDNAKSFNKLYNLWLPDVFIDNHTSNGADYQYTLTLIATQHNKLDPFLAEYLQNRLLPRLYADMKARNQELTPYVNARGTPDQGIAGFLDLPRYSSGYAALHHSFSFMPEAHMLKPFRDRVRSTYAFMDCMIRAIYDDWETIGAARQKAIEHTVSRDSFDLNWRLDPSRADTILFKGYTASYKPSDVSALERLYYDHELPYEKKIPYLNYYQPVQRVRKPLAYLVPQAYTEVIERLEWNGVALKQLKEDAELEVEMYYIRDFQSTQTPYEGHYLHSRVEVEKKTMRQTFRKGDYVVFTGQPSNRYIVETLEPQGADSFFAWNFFDSALSQKEYFSSYVFEELALSYLKEHPELGESLRDRKAQDAQFAQSAQAQLDFVYKNSPFYEKTHNLYPVARLVNAVGLPLD